MSANIENHQVLGDYPIIGRIADFSSISEIRAEETANLLSLDDMAKDLDLVSLIEAMKPADLAAAMKLLRGQVACELIERGGDV